MVVARLSGAPPSSSFLADEDNDDDDDDDPMLGFDFGFMLEACNKQSFKNYILMSILSHSCHYKHFIHFRQVASLTDYKLIL